MLAGGPGDAVITNIRGAGRGGSRHLIVADGRIALVRDKKVNTKNARRLTFAQLKAADGSAMFVSDHQLLGADVWQCPAGGRVTLVRRNQSPLELRWTGRGNAKVDVEAVLGAAFPGKVDQVTPDASAWIGYIVPRVVALVAAVALVIGGGTVAGKLLGGGAPAPQKAPPTTLAPDEVAIRQALASACPHWAPLADLPRTVMPTQDQVRGAVEAVTPHFVQASTLDPAIGAAEAELAWLSRWSHLPAEEAGRESLGRIRYAVQQVDSACAPRG